MMKNHVLLAPAYDISSISPPHVNQYPALAFYHRELKRTFPASSHGHGMKGNPPSPSLSPLHLGGVGGSPGGLGRRQGGFDGRGGNLRIGGKPTHQHATASFAVPETGTGTEASPTTEADETPRDGRGHELDGSGRTTTRALVDDDDFYDALDGTMDVAAIDAATAAGGVFEGGGGGEQTEGGANARDGSAVNSATPGGSQDSAGVEQGDPGSTTNVAGIGNNVAGDCGGVVGIVDDAETEGGAEPTTRPRGRHRSASQPDATINSNSHRFRQGLVQAGNAEVLPGAKNRHHGDDDGISSSASTELTLGRPDPTSVHWKFSRRLLQT